MKNEMPKNRPTRLSSVQVNRVQFDHIFTDSAVARGEKIAKDLAALKDYIAPVCDKTFVMMKNKQVWFDRNNAALYPKFEKFSLPTFKTKGQPSKNFSVDFEGFYFTAMTIIECQKSFKTNSGNPYLNSDGFYRTFSVPRSEYNNIILTEEINPDGGMFLCQPREDEAFSWNDDDIVTLVPIHRLRGKNAATMSYVDSLITWIKLGLIPEGLNDNQELVYRAFMTDYPKIEEYISVVNDNITFDGERFKNDVLSGAFTDTVFDYNFDIRGTLESVMNGGKKYSGSVDALKKELLECDQKRANIQPYEERQLTDVNKGHWDLFEQTESNDEAEVQLSQDDMLIARPPQMDVRLNGICAIDFGTKSTIVVCRDGEARMLRIGKGDYSKAPTMEDFENPTVIELRDITSFMQAYRNRKGRPFTEWNQVTVSHQAADAIFKENIGSSVYNSVFSELKRWAKDEQSYPILKDLQGVTQEIKPYVETNSIDEGDFDPIELYAYYLGLYINNMHHQIYLDYILSFPVNYKKDVRERIRSSFERGIKKSLPPALLEDEQLMKRFRVYLGASEPAAYAISALECFGLEPKEISDNVAYGVFDFGGGTTDFDFGVEYIPEERNRNFIIEQFGFNGDVLLGGENILELLAYEVYKANINEMRSKKIPFALPAGCEIFAGAETLVSRTKDASSHMNNRILAEKLRPIWERTDELKNFTEDAQSVALFSSEKDKEIGSYTVAVNLNIDVKALEKCIEERIRLGVVNLFQSMDSAFGEREIYPIHIFLAGNSCKSPVVKKLFDEFIAERELKFAESKQNDISEHFILHLPLGMKEVANESTTTEKPQNTSNVADQMKNAQADMDLDRQRTGKTGVAFGLLRCRRGGKDVKIINRNVDANDEMIFPYFLGDAGTDGNTFTVKIGRNVRYGAWAYFTVADETDFEIYYTSAPRALQGKMSAAEVSMIHCLIDDDEVSDGEDIGIYIRKVTPNQIEYAVGCPKDFDKDKERFKNEFKGKVYQVAL